MSTTDIKAMADAIQTRTPPTITIELHPNEQMRTLHLNREVLPGPVAWEYGRLSRGGSDWKLDPDERWRPLRDMVGVDSVRAHAGTRNHNLSVGRCEAADWDDVMKQVLALVRGFFLAPDVVRVVTLPSPGVRDSLRCAAFARALRTIADSDPKFNASGAIDVATRALAREAVNSAVEDAEAYEDPL